MATRTRTYLSPADLVEGLDESLPIVREIKQNLARTTSALTRSPGALNTRQQAGGTTVDAGYGFNPNETQGATYIDQNGIVQQQPAAGAQGAIAGGTTSSQGPLGNPLAQELPVNEAFLQALAQQSSPSASSDQLYQSPQQMYEQLVGPLPTAQTASPSGAVAPGSASPSQKTWLKDEAYKELMGEPPPPPPPTVSSSATIADMMANASGGAHAQNPATLTYTPISSADQAALDQRYEQALLGIKSSHIPNSEWNEKARNWADFYREGVLQSYGIGSDSQGIPREALDPLVRLQQQLQGAYNPSAVTDAFNPQKPDLPPISADYPVPPEGRVGAVPANSPVIKNVEQQKAYMELVSALNGNDQNRINAAWDAMHAAMQTTVPQDSTEPPLTQQQAYQNLTNLMNSGGTQDQIAAAYQALIDANHQLQAPQSWGQRAQPYTTESVTVAPWGGPAIPMSQGIPAQYPYSQTQGRMTDMEQLQNLLYGQGQNLQGQLQTKEAGLGVQGAYQGLLGQQQRARQALAQQATAAYAPEKYQVQQQVQEGTGQILSALAQSQSEQERLALTAGRSF